MGSGEFFVFMKGRIYFDSITTRKHPWWMWLLPLPIVWWAALLTAGCWSAGMSLVELLGRLSEAMDRPLVHPLDGLLRPVPAVLYHGVWDRRAGCGLQPEKPAAGAWNMAPPNGATCFRS